jgi:hypothetical protein
MSEIFVLPPLVDNGRLGYIQREKIFARPSTTRSKAPKNKAKKKIPCHRIRPPKFCFILGSQLPF